MTGREYLRNARKLLDDGKIDSDTYYAMLMNIDVFCEDFEYPYDGMTIICPDCGEEVIIEYGTARCESCGWMAADAELDEIMEGCL